MTKYQKQLLGLTTLTCLLLARSPAFSQPADSGPRLSEAVLAYTGSAAAATRLYNGPLYLGYDRHAQGHPFFLSDSALPGSADYDGITFPNLALSYDLAKDLVIIPDKQHSTWLQLLSDKLPGFTIGDHRFTWLAPDSNAINPPEAGYYELLFAGKARALVKHRKLVQNNGKAEENLSIYRQYDSWYLEMNNRFITIHSQKSLLSAFGAGDKGLRNLLRTRKLHFKKDPDAAMSAAAELLSQSNY
ncbi:MAG TPA: hypothetical protein VNW04_09725 [Puia sp.]|jgi:hypothetical protein|nr:hypothetical protein [Puia sp.]